MKTKFVLMFVLFAFSGYNPFMQKQRNTAILNTTDHKSFSRSIVVDSGTTWTSARILPRIGNQKTDIVLPELKDKPCDISVSIQALGLTAPTTSYTKAKYDFGKSHPSFPLLKEKKNMIEISVVFQEAIQTNIQFDVILFAEPIMLLP